MVGATLQDARGPCESQATTVGGQVALTDRTATASHVACGRFGPVNVSSGTSEPFRVYDSHTGSPTSRLYP